MVYFLESADFNQNEIQNATIQLLASDPVSPVNGQIWVNTTSWVLKIRANGVSIALGRLDQITAPTTNVTLNSQRITDLSDPVSDTDAATRGWVLAQLTDKDWKESCRVATTANITLSGAQTIDGVSVVAGDRVLVKNQSTGADNGIYVCAAGSWSRSSDANVSSEVTSGLTVFIEEGTTSGGKTYQLTTANPITLGSTALTFTMISSGSSGTVNKYAATIGDGATTQFTITHSLNTEDVTVSIRQASGNKEGVITGWRTTGSNTIRVDFATAPSSNQYRVIVTG